MHVHFNNKVSPLEYFKGNLTQFIKRFNLNLFFIAQKLFEYAAAEQQHDWVFFGAVKLF